MRAAPASALAMSLRLWKAKLPSRVAAARASFEMRHDVARVEPAGRPLPPFDLDRVGAALRVCAADDQRRRRAAVGAEANDALDAGARAPARRPRPLPPSIGQ